MDNLNWNTQKMLSLIQDGCDLNWKVDTMPAKTKFETTIIRIYHPMLGKGGPYLTIRGSYIPRKKDQTFDPDDCVIDGILLGDNYSNDSLSIHNRNNLLTPAYSNMQKYLAFIGMPNLYNTSNKFEFDDGYDNN